jgi:hypothetical protein
MGVIGLASQKTKMRKAMWSKILSSGSQCAGTKTIRGASYGVLCRRSL